MTGASVAVTAAMSESVESLLLQLWSKRDQAEAAQDITDKLVALCPTQMDDVEMYLPQFGHIVIALPEELPTVAPIERFLLSVCQLSIHIVRQARSPPRTRLGAA